MSTCVYNRTYCVLPVARVVQLYYSNTTAVESYSYTTGSQTRTTTAIEHYSYSRKAPVLSVARSSQYLEQYRQYIRVIAIHSSASQQLDLVRCTCTVVLVLTLHHLWFALQLFRAKVLACMTNPTAESLSCTWFQNSGFELAVHSACMRAVQICMLARRARQRNFC